MIKKVFVLFIIICSTNIVFSNDYYADINIEVYDDGSVSTSGVTNYDFLKDLEHSHNFTDKNKNNWILNMTFDDDFLEYVYELKLPTGVQITNLNTVPSFRIFQEGENIIIVGVGENTKFNILVEYTFKDLQNNENRVREHIYYFLFGVVSLFLSLVFFKIFRNKLISKYYLDKPNKKINNSSNIQKFEKLNLNERQKEIISLLNKHKCLTQKDLEEIMKIPKSSVSRNVQSLVARQIVEINKSGSSNFLSIKEIKNENNN